MGESKREAVEEKGPSSGRGASEDGPKWQSGSNSALLTRRVGETLERHILLSPTSWGRYRLVALIPSGDLSVHAKDLFLRAKPADGSKAVGESGKDDYDKLSLPTGSGFPEDILQ